MICSNCGILMRMVNAQTRPEQEGGTLKVFHVATMQCINEKCEKKNEEEQKTVLWESENFMMNEKSDGNDDEVKNERG